MIWFRGRKNCQRISENRRIKRSRESGFSLTRYLLWCVYENSRKNIKNIDVKINELFQYLKGDIQTFEGDCASSSDSDHGKKIIELDGMYNISTSSEKYHMNFYMYSQNDSDSKAVGLYKIEIALESEVAEDNFIWDNPPNGIFVGGQN